MIGSFSVDLPRHSPMFWNPGHILDRDHVHVDFLWSFTDNMPVQANNAARLLVSCFFFFCCCFYQDVNTRGRHSMMCTLWMGWQVIDSMKMEKRWRGGGWGKGESKESYRWAYWRVTQDYPSTDSPKTWWCRHGDTEQIHEKNWLKALYDSKLIAHWNTPVTKSLSYWSPSVWLVFLRLFDRCLSDLCKTL